ncbi:uncharacterized protein LOC104424762 [Eucalyptus grandis]|uniref:uncharacterized protein LOC104424762 n=1 Tax=Eucalyptus grandis TaxID=71139 RepID=UPI000525F8FB|nr:uncharacterized protein LOC104424762 [Eucalyptus grandis]
MQSSEQSSRNDVTSHQGVIKIWQYLVIAEMLLSVVDNLNNQEQGNAACVLRPTGAYFLLLATTQLRAIRHGTAFRVLCSREPDLFGPGSLVGLGRADRPIHVARPLLRRARWSLIFAPELKDGSSAASILEGCSGHKTPVKVRIAPTQRDTTSPI